MSKLKKLYTKAGENLSQIPWNEYPRPQLKRDSFFCLNGTWDFAVTKTVVPPTEYDNTILVPFAPESLLSGIGEVFPEKSILWYRKNFSLPEGFRRARVLLHIGASDQYTAVFLNGMPLAEHSGGYDPITVDITAALRAENTLVLRVTDRLDTAELPYGKQCRKRGGMWYTPVSGVWQTVWIESVEEHYIRRLKIHTEQNAAEITTEGVSEGTVTVKTPEGELVAPLTGGKAKITLSNPHFWSPESPYLYEFIVTSGAERVESYFALRTLTIETINGVPRLCLNGKPYFFHGLLDQGYWSDGLLTPADPTEFERDILVAKALGFNMLRKHIKIEPELFYYACDKLGMVVFQDMVNNGRYSFIRDTALPTVGLRWLPDRWLHRNTVSREAFIRSMDRTVSQLENHPCICYWTIFNEGWGQFCSTDLYRRLRILDDTRFIDTASGWFTGGETQVESRHVYFRKVKLRVGKKPLVLSEFGGYSHAPEGHVFNTEKAYGYGKCETREDFVKALRSLYLEQIVPLAEQGLSAAVYTQLSDVEDEINGLVSYDRKVLKVKPEEFADISEKLCQKQLS